MPRQFTGSCPDCGTAIWNDHARCHPCSQRARRDRDRRELRPPIPNTGDPSGETMLVPLTREKVAVIDAADADLVSGHLWCASKCPASWYAVTLVPDAIGRPKLLGMHVLIAGVPELPEVDHWDRDGLNNRRSNLRPCTSSQNKANRMPRSASGFKGVYARGNDRWQAKIRANGSTTALGTFATPEEAARAYDRAARVAFGEFARCNFGD